MAIISTLVEDTWPQAKDILKALSNYPEIKSIVGGVFPTMVPDEVIADPNVHCVAEGEGEQTIPEFCEAVRNGISPVNIRGTRVKDDQGAVYTNPSRPLTNVNDVIPDFSLFDERRFLRPLGAKIWKAMPIETYRTLCAESLKQWLKGIILISYILMTMPSWLGPLARLKNLQKCIRISECPSGARLGLKM